jgi:hypothetical protein
MSDINCPGVLGHTRDCFVDRFQIQSQIVLSSSRAIETYLLFQVFGTKYLKLLQYQVKKQTSPFLLL